MTSPVRVSVAPPITCATPKSVSLARSPEPERPVRHQHVRRLDVAVDHALAVGVGERVAERDADLEDLPVGELALLEQRVERAAAHELGDQVGALVVDGGLVERHDRRVLEPRGGARLALEAGVDHALAREHLDGHVAVEALVAGRPDGAEGAAAEALGQAVAIHHQAGSPEAVSRVERRVGLAEPLGPARRG